MTLSKICCDGCAYEHQTEPVEYGGSTGVNWITVQKSQSHSGDTLSAGEHHFCAEDCLKNFMLTGKKAPPKPASENNKQAQVVAARFKKLFPRKKISSR